MLLLVGLGNPGSEYAGNRHNVGRMAVDVIARRHNFGTFRKRFCGLAAEGMLDSEKTIALKPETFMNDSGKALAETVRFYKLAPSDVLVVHDDIDLAPGKMRIKSGGGNGGHNGLRSIDQHIGADYRRLRIGVAHPGDRDQVSNYVLADFSKGEKLWLAPLLDAIAEHAGLLVRDDARFLTSVAQALTPPKAKKPSSEAPSGI